MIDTNPIKRTSAPKLVDKAPEIFSVDELTALLNAAQSKASDVVPMLSIAAFTGLRDGEIKRLDWSEVDLKRGFVEIKALKAKSARRRLVRIQPNLSEWLAPYGEMHCKAMRRQILFSMYLLRIVGRLGGGECGSSGRRPLQSADRSGHRSNRIETSGLDHFARCVENPQLTPEFLRKEPNEMHCRTCFHVVKHHRLRSAPHPRFQKKGEEPCHLFHDSINLENSTHRENTRSVDAFLAF